MASANGGVRGCPGRLHRFCGVSSRRRPHCLSCWTLPIGAPGDSGSKPPGSTRPISFPRSARTTRTPHSGWPHDCGSGRREGPGGDQAGGLVLRLKSTRDASSSRRCGTTSHSRRSSRHLGVADFDALLIMGCVEQHFVRFDCFLVEDFAHPALRQIAIPVPVRAREHGANPPAAPTPSRAALPSSTPCIQPSSGAIARRPISVPSAILKVPQSAIARRERGGV
jgi:hypothetical protein